MSNSYATADSCVAKVKVKAARDLMLQYKIPYAAPKEGVDSFEGLILGLLNEVVERFIASPEIVLQPETRKASKVFSDYRNKLLTDILLRDKRLRKYVPHDISTDSTAFRSLVKEFIRRKSKVTASNSLHQAAASFDGDSTDDGPLDFSDESCDDLSDEVCYRSPVELRNRKKIDDTGGDKGGQKRKRSIPDIWRAADAAALPPQNPAPERAKSLCLRLSADAPGPSGGEVRPTSFYVEMSPSLAFSPFITAGPFAIAKARQHPQGCRQGIVEQVLVKLQKKNYLPEDVAATYRLRVSYPDKTYMDIEDDEDANSGLVIWERKIPAMLHLALED